MAIKKISAARLKPGMFIHDLNCGWMDHPFLTTRFKLESGKDVKKILDAGIREVYVDTELGLDAGDAPTAEEVSRELDDEMAREAEKQPEPRASAREELARAQKIHAEANLIMRGIMSDVRLGRQVQVEQIEPMVDKMAASILRNSGALISLNRIK
ncbi:MAG: DUF3391 domain-containing protein, partial [Rhodocyclaceae bacterium]|nr:DUF3391 domain-containing protein [Rhodocyclaceae bacterium]